MLCVTLSRVENFNHAKNSFPAKVYKDFYPSTYHQFKTKKSSLIDTKMAKLIVSLIFIVHFIVRL